MLKHSGCSDVDGIGFDANRTYIKVVKEKDREGGNFQSALFQNSTLLFDGAIPYRLDLE